METPHRLNKTLATHLGIGRRQADFLIEEGRVLINGQRATLGQRVSPKDEVKVDDQRIFITNAPVHKYLMLHKPVGYVCSRRQQGNTPTIYSLLPPECHHLHPVGRLDKDSSGLLLLTNDGDFALRMTHPKFAKVKQYQVTLNHALDSSHRQTIDQHGIELRDGPSRLRLEPLREGDKRSWLVTMHEGRNRQIRRTFAALGYEVKKLHRIQFGAYTLGSLKSGKFVPTEILK